MSHPGPQLKIKDTTDTDRCASYLDLHLEVYNEGRLRTKLYDKRDDSEQFSHCELSIYMYEYFSSTCIWSIHLSVDSIFQRLWFLSGFPWYRVAVDKETTESRVLIG